MKAKSIPSKGWPVIVHDEHSTRRIRISSGEIDRNGYLLCLMDGVISIDDNPPTAWESWEPYKLPNGKLLKWPESKGKKK